MSVSVKSIQRLEGFALGDALLQKAGREPFSSCQGQKRTRKAQCHIPALVFPSAGATRKKITFQWVRIFTLKAVEVSEPFSLEVSQLPMGSSLPFSTQKAMAAREGSHRDTALHCCSCKPTWSGPLSKRKGPSSYEGLWPFQGTLPDTSATQSFISCRAGSLQRMWRSNKNGDPRGDSTWPIWVQSLEPARSDF